MLTFLNLIWRVRLGVALLVALFAVLGLTAGYGAAQAVPGPLFTFAAFLGASMNQAPGGWLGGLVALLAIFLPSFLLVLGALPFWEALRHRDGIRRALAGMNAAVVGILGAALYDPVWAGAIHSRADFCLALAAYGLLVVGLRIPAIVATLGTLGLYRGVMLLWTGGKWIEGLPNSLKALSEKWFGADVTK